MITKYFKSKNIKLSIKSFHEQKYIKRENKHSSNATVIFVKNITVCSQSL